MRAHHKKIYAHLALALAAALLFSLVYAQPGQAGDPDEIIGPTDLFLYECFETGKEDDDEFDELVDLTEVVNEIIENSTGNYSEDLKALIRACDHLADGPGKLVKIAKTKIEGYVYEFHPRDYGNPAMSEWFAVPSSHVPVIAEGVTFEIFWVSEPDGYYYFYKTRFGQGPIVLNLRLPPDAHAINPNILIESTGLDETWTVFLGFYRGDIPPPNPDQLKTPNGNFLPFGNTKFNSIVGLDGKSALPGVGETRPEQVPKSVLALAAILVVVLPAAGVVTLRRNGQNNRQSIR